MSRYAVIGNPVSHSKSPLIHSLFARQTGQTLEYSAITVEADAVEDFVTRFFREGGAGLNVTVPYKEIAFKMVKQDCTGRASRARAVNTLYQNSAGSLCGDNTDGLGLITDLRINHGVTLKGKRILMLGAGGAVRGALAGLVDEAPLQITIANRTLEKAVQLQQEFRGLANLLVCDYGDLDTAHDLIINGTSASLQGEVPPLDARLVGPDTCCYDMLYAKGDTPFTAWGKMRGAGLVLDGLGMLVEQAAESFRIWRGIKPATPEVIEQVRTSLSA
ncbi:MAG: hypothetical protein RLZZ385_732 [Pseudomonadota bacterium]